MLHLAVIRLDRPLVLMIIIQLFERGLPARKRHLLVALDAFLIKIRKFGHQRHRIVFGRVAATAAAITAAVNLFFMILLPPYFLIFTIDFYY